MAFCPAECVDFDLVANPAQCNLSQRRKIPSKFHFYACDTELPSPLDATALEALYTSGAIVMSSELSNFTAEDPTYEDVTISDCRPASRVVISRTFTAMDRVAVTGATTDSPSTAINYFDYRFWDDKQVNSARLNVMVEYCDGDVVIALDRSGQPLSVDITAFINWEAAAAPGGTRTENKNLSLVFNGDPLALFNPPAFNRNGVNGDITVYTYPA